MTAGGTGSALSPEPPATSFKAPAAGVLLVGILLVEIWGLGTTAPVWAATSVGSTDPGSAAGPDALERGAAPSEAPAAEGDEPAEVDPNALSAVTSDGTFRVLITADPSPIPLNEMFSLQFRVVEADHPERLVPGALVTADAWMPEHKHGTNLKPRINSHGDGTASGVGFLWHMEGNWELKVGVRVDGKMERAVFPVLLEP